MIKIKEAVIVEGKYDKIKLSSIVDTVIITTEGFRIFKNPEKLSLIRYYAEKTGIVILTDSDSAGFKIRGFLKGAVNKGKITNVYIPDIFGKEKRKEKPSAEGKLGVEGIPVNIIADAFRKAGISSSEESSENDITSVTFFELGLSGKPDSKAMRTRLQKFLGLPELMSSSSLMEILNTMYTADELKEIIKQSEVI
ncbi:MAG: DUF4093 domain-containing protein [Oscillospiraceae bacterium]|nr:DUF4093 domain-containing protein [Oscillospiraceae bacterium]